MTEGALKRVVALPPPAGTILLYAADGLSSRQGDLSPAGRPLTPKRSIWVPMFRDYIDSEDGLGILYILAEEGMRAWGCTPDQVNSLSGAFEDITFKAQSIAALEHFAATAHEKVVLYRKPKAVEPSPAILEPADLLIASITPNRPSPRQLFQGFTP